PAYCVTFHRRDQVPKFLEVSSGKVNSGLFDFQSFPRVQLVRATNLLRLFALSKHRDVPARRDVFEHFCPERTIRRTLRLPCISAHCVFSLLGAGYGKMPIIGIEESAIW